MSECLRMSLFLVFVSMISFKNSQRDDLLTDKYFDSDIHDIYGMRQYSIFVV